MDVRGQMTSNLERFRNARSAPGIALVMEQTFPQPITEAIAIPAGWICLTRLGGRVRLCSGIRGQ